MLSLYHFVQSRALWTNSCVSWLGQVTQQKIWLLTHFIETEKIKFDQHVPFVHCLVLMFLLISTDFYLFFWTATSPSVLSLWITAIAALCNPPLYVSIFMFSCVHKGIQKHINERKCAIVLSFSRACPNLHGCLGGEKSFSHLKERCF